MRRRPFLLLSALVPVAGAQGERVPLAVGEHGVESRWKALLDHLAQRAGVQWRILPMPWPRAQAFAEAGEGLMFGLNRTREREPRFAFSLPVITVQTWLVVRAAEAGQFGDGLAQRSVCMARGSAYPSVFADRRVAVGRWVGANQGDPAALRMLLAGRCDAAVLTLPGPDAAMVQRRLAFYGLDASGLAVLPKPVTDSPLHLVTGHQSPWLPLLRRFDPILQQDRALIDHLASQTD